MAAVRFPQKFNLVKFIFTRNFSSHCKTKKGVLLGAYTDDKGFKLTCNTYKFDFTGELKSSLSVAGIKKGKVRVFYKVNPNYDVVAVAGLGKQDVGYNKTEEINESKEDIRTAAAVGSQVLQDLECTSIDIEDFDDAEAAAEGASLGLFLYQEFKNESKRKKVPEINLLYGVNKESWNHGIIKGNAQNLARKLTDAPANRMTPTQFAEAAKQELEKLEVKVYIYDKDWVIKRQMGAFLSVAQGSPEPLKFVEMRYNGGPLDQKPVVLVGKGVTFDSGGISLKPARKMDEMRGDMGGAACVVGTMKAIACLQLPINVIGITPLCENMPSGHAIKPGDVVCAMNGKTIKIDNTDAEGRLILADALCYASAFEPQITIDIATLTGSMRVALGNVLSGVFTNSNKLWEEVRKAGICSGDRVWRFPLYKEYSKKMTDYPSVDINNIGKGTGGGACTAAAFLKEFAPSCNWMHMDIASVMDPDTDVPYLRKGMTGRPTRTLIYLLEQISSNCPESC